MQPATQEKARRLAKDGSVTRLPTAETYQVDGDHGTYLVVVAEGLQFCTCPAQGLCSHLAAVALVALGEDS